jgi:hypothetical protein
MTNTIIGEITVAKLIADCEVHKSIFGPRYDPFRMDIYFSLNKPEIIKFLVRHCLTVNYENTELIEMNKTSETQVLDDIRQVLIDSIFEIYKQFIVISPNKFIVLSEARLLLEPLITSKLDHFIFKRTANYCTPYGFM